MSALRKSVETQGTPPNARRDLIVRAAGYSSYFVQLTKARQNDVVARTEIEQTL